jgi:hypothetical protein
MMLILSRLDRRHAVEAPQLVFTALRLRARQFVVSPTRLILLCNGVNVIGLQRLRSQTGGFRSEPRHWFNNNESQSRIVHD